MPRSTPWIICLLLTSFASVASAERAPEDKATADFILTGKVQRVFTRRDGRLTEYIVQIQIKTVHRGDTLKEGHVFYASCFMKSAPLFPVAEARGHRAVPKEGQVIKAWVHQRGGRHEGNYKDWFEVVTEQTEDK